jgi:hypothetical protein
MADFCKAKEMQKPHPLNIMGLNTPELLVYGPLRCTYPPGASASPAWYSDAVARPEERGKWQPVYTLHEARVLARCSTGNQDEAEDQGGGENPPHEVLRFKSPGCNGSEQIGERKSGEHLIIQQQKRGRSLKGIEVPRTGRGNTAMAAGLSETIPCMAITSQSLATLRQPL